MPGTVHLLALSSALLSAVATILIRQGLRAGGIYTGYWINLVVGTAALWTAVALTGGPDRLSAAGVALFGLAGLIGTVAGRLLRFISIEKVGASISAALMNLHPFVSTGLAILLLGERVTPPIIVGTLVIVLGTTLLSLGGRSVGFRPWHLALPVLSATCFGVVAILRKVGLGEMGPITGSAINVTTALIAFTAFLVASGQPRAMAAGRGRSLVYFVVAGISENTAVFLTVVALGIGHVSVVTPLSGTAPIFVLFLSFFFLRGIDVLTARIVAGTVLIVLGVYLITALSGR
ncbi:MAG: DMT family transporter [Candidatus Rokubacteria bacterium]|nr:DMT family transporter [Candidatus Rokubacteria bacterium]